MNVPGLITEFSPVIIRQVRGELTNDEMRTQLEGTTVRLKEMAQQGHRTVTIVDLTQANPPNALQQNPTPQFRTDSKFAQTRGLAAVAPRDPPVATRPRFSL